MDKCVMQKSDDSASFASHRSLHGVARTDRKEANQIAWVEVSHDDRNVRLLKVSFDSFAEKQSDIFRA